MSPLLQFILVAAIALIAGIIIGRMLSNSGANAAHKRELEEELQQARKELADYKQDVSEHFSQTAELVNNLTNSYRDVHTHLASGSEKLCNTDQLLDRIQQPLLEKEARPSTEDESAASGDHRLDDLATAGNHNSQDLDELKDSADKSNTDQDPAQDTTSAPKDYAPKDDPRAAGTLSEGYGLNETEKTEKNRQAQEKTK